MDPTKRVVHKYRQKINPPYGLEDFPYVFATIFVLILIPLLAIVTVKTTEPTSYAAEDTPVQATRQTEFASNELLVKLKKPAKEKVNENASPEKIGVKSLEKINKKLGVEEFEQIVPETKKTKKNDEVNNWFEVELPGQGEVIKGEFDEESGKINSPSIEADTLQEAIDEFKKDPNVEVVEPNFTVKILATPNDPYYSSSGSWGQPYDDLWGIKKINSAAAWNKTTGSSSVVVADIDTGVDRNHVDLANNMWVNSAETPNNGIDDDGNGYIDDYYGWDWVNNDNSPMDDHGHGTHTAGTIAGVGNNSTGVVGVNWSVKIMALKFLSSGGSGSLSNGIRALEYAADMGADVSSNSWGCFCNSTSMDNAIRYEHDRGMVISVAAGNSNWDALSYSPASTTTAMTIAASDYLDRRASFSNYGEKIDVAAPGVDILSTRAAINPMCTSSRTVGTNYCRVSGTSMATPHVAGLAALLWAQDPSLTNEEIRQLIREGADDLGSVGKDRNFGYGRINSNNSVSATSPKPLAPIITSPKGRSTVSGSTVNIVGSVPGPNFASYKIEKASSRSPSSWSTLKISSTQVINGVLATVSTSNFSGNRNIIRVTATKSNGKIYQYQVHDIRGPADTTPPSRPTGVKAKLVSASRIDVSWNASSDNVAVSNYYLYRNGGLYKVITGTKYIDRSVSAGRTYSYYVRARDTSGNLSSKSATVKITIPAGSPVRKKGDLNGDGRINIRDLSILISRWGTRSTVADINGDGRVNIRDLSILISRWGR